MTETILSTKNLRRIIGGQIILDTISIQVERGSIVGVIGPNGAGKTTLMECIAGLQPHDGIVEIEGSAVCADSRHSFIFYQPDQVLPYPDHGVYSTLEFFKDMLSVESKRLSEIIERLKMQSVLRKAVKELSRGYQKRLLIAIGLMSTSPILILDEPFEGLDIKQTKEVVSILRDEKAVGRTLILSIHQIVDAERIADQFLLLAEGRLLGGGNLAHLRTKAGLTSGNLEEVFVSLT